MKHRVSVLPVEPEIYGREESYKAHLAYLRCPRIAFEGHSCLKVIRQF